jgi:hypothetical protein
MCFLSTARVLYCDEIPLRPCTSHSPTNHTKAVMLNLVQPLVTGWRLAGFGGKARCNKPSRDRGGITLPIGPLEPEQIGNG